VQVETLVPPVFGKETTAGIFPVCHFPLHSTQQSALGIQPIQRGCLNAGVPADC